MNCKRNPIIPCATESYVLWLVSGLAFCLLGCGPREETEKHALDTGSPSASPVEAKPMPTLFGGAASPGSPGSGSGGLTASVSPPPAIDFTAAERPQNTKGTPMSDLELLNAAVQVYYGRFLDPSAVTVRGNFQTPEEELAAQTAAMEAQRKRYALRDLSDLVKVGVIKSIPAAPPGKKYVFDPKSSVVIMVDQK